MVWSIVPAGKKDKERVNSRIPDSGVRIPKSESAGFFGLLIAERGSPGKGGCRGFPFHRGTEDDSGDGQGFCGKGVEAPGRRNRGDAHLPLPALKAMADLGLMGMNLPAESGSSQTGRVSYRHPYPSLKLLEVSPRKMVAKRKIWIS